MAKKWCLYLFIFIFCMEFVVGLGISPAIVEINFVPGEVHEIVYSVDSEDPQREIEAFIGGDFVKYAEISPTNFRGSGSFKVTIRLPDSVDEPGIRKIGVGAREAPGEEEFIGTKVEVIGVIKINVPYPGKYAEGDLNVRDGNVKEEIPVEVYVINKGKEGLDVNVNVEFFTEKGFLDRREMASYLSFKPVFLEPNQDRYFRKYLDTTGLRPGNYIAEAVVNYGKEVRFNRMFRIGSLFVNITNFTDTLIVGEGVQKFLIDIESMWNGDLNEVFADVNISNATKIIEFRTPSVDLKAWEKRTLEWFLDTSGLEGEYDTNIVLNYAKDKSFASGKLNVLRGKEIDIKFIVIGIIAIAIILIIVFVIWILKRNAWKIRRKK